MSAFSAAAAAAWLHGALAAAYGSGMTAEDIISSLSQVLNQTIRNVI